jgi:thiamine biosynthesis lipoprotein
MPSGASLDVKPPGATVHRRVLLARLRRAERSDVAAPGEDGPPGAFDLLNARRAAMGSYFEVRLPAALPGALDLAGRALDRIEALEAQLTVYRDDSEVSRLNSRAHLGPVAVEPGLFALIERAVALGRETGGAYDVAAGALSLAWGFTRGPRRVPDAEALAEARAKTGSRHLTIEPASRTVAFDRPGVVLNFGSIGKGYALDQAAAILRDHWWPTQGLLHGGQSSLFALGSPPWTLGGRWEVTLHNPNAPNRPLGTFRLRDRGLGTSGASFQQFEEGGRRFGHILDPRTGEPPRNGPASVTVLAPTAAEADALSTAFYLLGPVAAAELVERRPEVSALFVEPSPSDAPPRLVALNLGPLDFEPGPSVRLAAWL